MKIFNTSGPVNEKKHYLIDPLSRWKSREIDKLIEQEKYFVLHAPRQSGKTSSMLALQKRLNQEGHYYCLYVNVEPAQVARANVEKGITSILRLMSDRMISVLDDPKLDQMIQKQIQAQNPETALNLLLKSWCRYLKKPLILIIDEIDSLVGDTLISVLRQLREGYDTRPQEFPQTVILCGVRDVRDYRIKSESQGTELKGGSAFNIKDKSLTLGNFNLNQIKNLLNQHSKEVGQQFNDNIWEVLWSYTHGQPWLVNALANELCFEMPETNDAKTSIDLVHLHIAKERLIQRRDTHLDQLVDKLKEERVKRIIEPLLSGVDTITSRQEDDTQYCLDLGLIRRENDKIQISNLIYQEIIPRCLTFETQNGIAEQQHWYLDSKTKGLDFPKLLSAFQDFFRKNIEHWIKDFNYPEAGPQLLLQAFLQRIINGGGRIEREYGLGRGRVDLLIEWPLEDNAFINQGRIQTALIECKVLHTKSLETTLSEGLKQTAEYCLRSHPQAEAHLIIFNRDQSKTWEQKIWQQNHKYQGKTISVWGL